VSCRVAAPLRQVRPAECGVKAWPSRRRDGSDLKTSLRSEIAVAFEPGTPEARQRATLGALSVHAAAHQHRARDQGG